jgi:ribonuclease H-related protein
MAKKNYYAVKTESVTHIYNNWPECEAYVKGRKGVKFKGFALKGEAQDFLDSLEGFKPKASSVKTKSSVSKPKKETTRSKKSVEDEIEEFSNTVMDIPVGEIWAFVDGSFTPKCERAGWGYALFDSQGLLNKGSGVTKAAALSRNIDGELMASLEAIKESKNHAGKLVLHHDYTGIRHWALGEWKTKAVISARYAEVYKELGVSVKFIKVAAHTGVTGNELADRLASQAITDFLN